MFFWSFFGVFISLILVFAQAIRDKDSEETKPEPIRVEDSEETYSEEMMLDTLFRPGPSAVIVLSEPKVKPKEENQETTTATPPLPLAAQVWSNCEEAVAAEPNSAKFGEYLINLPTSNLGPFNVSCQADVKGGGAAWTRIQHHSREGAIDFNVGWTKYIHGFGNFSGDFFLGLLYIHALTHSEPHELWIQLEESDHTKHNAYYNLFAIGNLNQGFPLYILGKHKGSLSDALRENVGEKFSTFDSDNDAMKTKNCAKEYLGGWWFLDCQKRFSNLNGQFPEKDKALSGIQWDIDSATKYTRSNMFIRPASMQ